MNKTEVKQRVLKDGKPLNLNLFKWNENNRIFSSEEANLVADFSLINNCVFKAGDNCIFKTGDNCYFITGDNCVFDTGNDCYFDTGSDGVYKTGSNCFFDTTKYGIYKTGTNCSFKTRHYCTFNTPRGCTFETGYDCIIVRRDNYEACKLKNDQTIRLDDSGEFIVLDEKDAKNFWHKFYSKDKFNIYFGTILEELKDKNA